MIYILRHIGEVGVILTYRHYVSRKTTDYLNDRFPTQTPLWLDALDGEIERIISKWRLTPSGHEADSRFGTIMYAESDIYGSVAVKIVPWFSERLMNEIYCYKALPYAEMCTLYDFDERLGAMLLRYVSQSPDADKRVKEDMFKSMFEHRKSADGEKRLPKYEDVLKTALDTAAKAAKNSNDARLGAYFESIRRAGEKTNDFSNDLRYILHGDAHEYNMLAGEDGAVLIDPLGYVAPFEFEYARYLGTAVKHVEMTDGELFGLINRLLPDGASIHKTLTAFAIDTTLRACNTFWEGDAQEDIVYGASWAARAWKYADALALA